MQIIREKFNNVVRGLAETLGFIFNPLLLSIKGENSQLLVFYFHGLYQSLATERFKSYRSAEEYDGQPVS